jgi:hypothetical protein
MVTDPKLTADPAAAAPNTPLSFEDQLVGAAVSEQTPAALSAARADRSEPAQRRRRLAGVDAPERRWETTMPEIDSNREAGIFSAYIALMTEDDETVQMARDAGYDPDSALGHAFLSGVDLEAIRAGLRAGPALPDGWAPPAEPDPARMALDYYPPGSEAACVAGIVAQRGRGHYRGRAVVVEAGGTLNGNRRAAAKLMGLTRTASLHERIRELSMDEETGPDRYPLAARLTPGLLVGYPAHAPRAGRTLGGQLAEILIKSHDIHCARVGDLSVDVALAELPRAARALERKADELVKLLLKSEYVDEVFADNETLRARILPFLTERAEAAKQPK